GRVTQGGALAVSVSGLEPGQQIAATLFSDPIVIHGIRAAAADGTVAFTVQIPADLTIGAHTLVITSAGLDPIEIPVQVLAAGALPATGGTFPVGFVTVLALVTVIGGAVLAGTRRRRET